MPMDKSYKYKPDTVNVYFENRIKGTLHQVDVRKTIKEITTDKKWVLSLRKYAIAYLSLSLSMSVCLFCSISF